MSIPPSLPSCTILKTHTPSSSSNLTSIGWEPQCGTVALEHDIFCTKAHGSLVLKIIPHCDWSSEEEKSIFHLRIIHDFIQPARQEKDYISKRLLTHFVEYICHQYMHMNITHQTFISVNIFCLTNNYFGRHLK